MAVEVKAEGQKEAKDSLLVLSKFLRAAAAKRQSGDESSPENRAFEGALLLVYGGEAGAVVAMEQLISGSDEKVPTVDQTPSEYTCRLPLLHCSNDRSHTTLIQLIIGFRQASQRTGLRVRSLRCRGSLGRRSSSIRACTSNSRRAFRSGWDRPYNCLCRDDGD